MLCQLVHITAIELVGVSLSRGQEIRQPLSLPFLSLEEHNCDHLPKHCLGMHHEKKISAQNSKKMQPEHSWLKKILQLRGFVFKGKRIKC